MMLLASKTARSSATSAARCATARRLSSGDPSVPSWLPREGLANGEGGLGYGLVPPGAALRQVCPFGEHRREIEVAQVALKQFWPIYYRGRVYGNFSNVASC